MKPKLTEERLKEVLLYDPDSGEFFRNKGRGGFKAGTVAGSRNQFYGYVHISVDRKMYKAHRLAFLYMGDPLTSEEEVDHLNGDRSDNRWENLRKSCRSKNSRNCSLRSDNNSGYVGVGFHKKRGQWRARVGHKHIGWFSCKEDAIAARRDHPDNYEYSERHGLRGKAYNNSFKPNELGE